LDRESLQQNYVMHSLFDKLGIVNCRPLPPDELSAIIHEACGDDNSTAMLTQVCDADGIVCVIVGLHLMFSFNFSCLA